MWRIKAAVVVVGLASFAIAAPAGQAQDIGFCANSKVVGAMKNLGPTGSEKTFDVPDGTWCQYGGTHGSYVEKIQHVTRAKFAADKQSRRGKTLGGLGTQAFSTSGPGTFVAVSALEGTTEIVVGANASQAKLKAVAKTILALVH